MKKNTVSRPAPDRLVYLLLFVSTLLVYSQVHNFAFLELDDVEAIPANPFVRDGFTWAGMVWALTTGYSGNWFPVTWYSHMLVSQLFGLDAGWHHLANVFIHAVDAVFLFALMKRMTSRVWESAFVACVFALHPVHVESVAWVVERKDVLFAFFWFLTTWLYLDFLERRTVRNYLLMAAAFCLGLMSKQMIVTLPFALLLLDVWPLKRSGAKTLAQEKFPLVALAIAASLLAFLAQKSWGAVQSLASIPVTTRVANVLVSYIAYLGHLVWPTGLVAFYTYPFHLPLWKVGLAAVALVAISALTILSFRTRPYLAVGWFWYLGTLAPVIGIVQVGSQSRADRYTYIPLIGISIMMAFGLAGIHKIVAPAAIAVCAAWTVLTWFQVQYWKDGITLHGHSIAVDDGNYRAHEDLGVELAKTGRYQDALRELYKSVEEKSDQVNARNSLAAVLFHLGHKDEAMEQYRRAIALDPRGALLHLNLGSVLADVGNHDQAIQEFSAALRLDPKMAGAAFGVGKSLVMQHRENEAVPYFLEALRIDPNFGQARDGLEELHRMGVGR